MKKMRKVFLMLGLTVSTMFMLTGCGKTKVNLDKYVTFEASGYDSIGRVNYMFDYDAFEKDYADKIKLPKDNNELKSIALLTGESPMELMLDYCVSPTIDQNTGLSNGDTVTLKWKCNDAAAEEYFNVDLEYSDLTYTVIGLPDVVKFDPFEYITVSFSGTEPYGMVSVEKTDSIVDDVYFNVESYDELKNGSQVTIKASVNNEEAFITRYGKIPGTTEKQYTAEGLNYYIESYNEIPADTLQYLENAAMKQFNSENLRLIDDFNTTQSYIGSIDSVEYMGYYFFTPKSKDNIIKNSVVLIYKINEIVPLTDYSVKEDIEYPIEYYAYVYANNFLMSSDGICSTSDLEFAGKWTNKYNTGIRSMEHYEDYTHVMYLPGYVSMDDMYNDWVVGNSPEFDCDVNMVNQ